MAKEKNKEYWKKYYETHKEKRKEQVKKYRESHKDHYKKYYEDHREERKEQAKKYRESHKDHYKKYYETHKEQIKKYHEAHKDLVLKFNKYRRYFYKKFYRFITLKNFVTIMKLEDVWLKRSIMTKLGKGTIDQDEAVMLSGMTFTEDDQKEMNEWWNICRCKSALYRKDLYIHNH